jgi:capsular polysaccharide biosynthesis protein/Mrp family chromosome partitioning ATPase
VRSSTAAGEAPTLADYGRVLRSRSSVIVAVVALTLVVGLARDLTSTPLYRASAEVLLSRDSPADRLTGTSDGDTRGDPERFIQTQLQIARTDELAGRVLDARGLSDRKPSELVAAMKVMAPQGSDVLRFEVQDPSGPLAVRLARSYAAQFAAYQRRLDEAALRRALATVDAKLAALADELPTAAEVPPAVGAEGRGNTPLYEALMEKKLQLQALAPLQAGKTLVLSSSGEPARVRPRPKRDLAVALGLGLLVGVLLAFVLEAVDRRVDSVRGIADILGIPLLGQVRLHGDILRPLRARLLRRPDAPPVHGVEALLPSVEAALGEVARPAPGAVLLARSGTRGDPQPGPAAVVLATSASRGDGQPSVMAALSVALARSGKRVILVDLDPTRSLDIRFGVWMRPGVVDVAAGSTELDDALIRCDAESPRLSFLPLGTSAGRLGSILNAPIRGVLIAALRARADIVLLNAPPLASADAVRRAAAGVDAVLVVVSVDTARERVLGRLGSELALLAPLKLGFVATGRAVEPLPIEDVARVVPLAGSSGPSASGAPAVAVGDDPTAGNGHSMRRGDT